MGSLFLLFLLDHHSISFVGLNKFIFEYRAVILSLGTVLLISVLALSTTLLASKYADQRELSNRRIQSELKLSEFRQKWIDELRADLARLISITTAISGTAKSTDERKLAILEMYEIDSRIRLRLNPFEAEAQIIEQTVIQLVNSATLSEGDEGFKATIKNREMLANLSSRYLKNEWDVLRENLKKIEKPVR